MADIQTPEKIIELPVAIIKNMVALSTSGLGLVVALAWNELVRKLVETYIDPYLGKGSGIISLLIYAIAITLLAVMVTMQLTALQRKIETLHQKVTRSTKKEVVEK
jgi:hypothetical protein